MNARWLGIALLASGTLGLAASIVWGTFFYSEMDSELQALWCLLWNAAPCRLAKAAARAAGQFPYEPYFFWISAGLVIAGRIILNATTTPGRDKTGTGA